MYEKYIKRLLDFILSLVALIILMPLMIIVYIAVRIKMGKPAIFKQPRPGKDEKVFTLYKFRTMAEKKDKHGELLPDVERVTKFGKFLRNTSIDELPELINILKGDMSIVGPRPLEVRYLPYYNENEKHRHDARPGLTGLAQVNGRNGLNWENRFEYDIEYVNNITFINDVKILFKTFYKVVKKDNVIIAGTGNVKNFDIERKETIRRLNCNDIEDNEKVLKEYIEDLRKEYYNGDINEEVDRIYNNMKNFTTDGTAIILGLYILEELQGFIWGYKENDDTIHVNYFYVRDEYRKFGFGKKLLANLEKVVRKNIELNVDKNNVNAYRFYLKSGFEKIEENDKNFKMIKKVWYNMEDLMKKKREAKV